MSGFECDTGWTIDKVGDEFCNNENCVYDDADCLVTDYNQLYSRVAICLVTVASVLVLIPVACQIVYSSTYHLSSVVQKLVTWVQNRFLSLSTVPISSINNPKYRGGGGRVRSVSYTPHASGIYHEKQTHSNCALHALNMFLGRKVFNAAQLHNIAKDLEQREQLVYGRRNADRHSDSRGNFSIDVLRQAGLLEGINLEFLTWERNDTSIACYLVYRMVRNEFNVVDETSSHYFTIRKYQYEWYLLDSLFPPVVLSEMEASTKIASFLNRPDEFRVWFDSATRVDAPSTTDIVVPSNSNIEISAVDSDHMSISSYDTTSSTCTFRSKSETTTMSSAARRQADYRKRKRDLKLNAKLENQKRRDWYRTIDLDRKQTQSQRNKRKYSEKSSDQKSDLSGKNRRKYAEMSSDEKSDRLAEKRKRYSEMSESEQSDLSQKNLQRYSSMSTEEKSSLSKMNREKYSKLSAGKKSEYCRINRERSKSRYRNLLPEAKTALFQKLAERKDSMSTEQKQTALDNRRENRKRKITGPDPPDISRQTTSVCLDDSDATGNNDLQTTDDHLESLGGEEQELHLPSIDFESIATDFTEELNSLKIEECAMCKRRFINLNIIDEKCKHCRGRNRGKWGPENGIQPDAIVPAELSELTMVEEMLISVFLPEMMVVRLKGGQFAYNAHCISFPQNVQTLATRLPRNPSDLDLVIVRKPGLGNTHRDFKVNKRRVIAALKWLKENNDDYRSIEIDADAVLPDDGVPDNLLYCNENENENLAKFVNENAEEIVDTEGPTVGPTVDTISSSTVIPESVEQEREVDGIRKLIEDTKLSVTPWPARGEQPVNDFNTVRLFSKAFPTLFPTGKGDPTDPSYGETVEVEKAEAIQYLFHYTDPRFAQHPRFRYFCFNMLQRHRAVSSTKVFIKKKNEKVPKTVEELKDLIRQENTEILNSLQRFCANIRGTQGWKYSRRRDLLRMIENVGVPQFFLTISAADNQWEKLQSLLSQYDGRGKSPCENVINNPGFCTTYFDLLLENTIQNVLKPYLNVEDYWFIYEWQGRGSIHCHGLVWCDLPIPSDHDLFKDYLDTVITAVNPFLEEDDDRKFVHRHFKPEKARDLKIHPSSEPPKTEMCNDDIGRLVNTVQRHTKCSTTTCLKTVNKKVICKAKFPKPLRKSSEFVVPEDKPDDPENHVFEPRRNDNWVNAYNPFVLSLVRSNIDIKYIDSLRQLVDYLVKYVAKMEPSSEDLQSLVSNFSTYSTNTTSAEKVYTRIMTKMVAQRDYSAQEVMHYILGLRGFTCSRTFVPVSLATYGEFSKVDDCPVIKQSIYEKYLRRPENLDTICFHTMVAEYNEKYGKRRVEAIPVIMPLIKWSPENQEAWFEQQLRIKLPHRSDEDLLEDNTNFTQAYFAHGFVLPEHILEKLNQIEKDIFDLEMEMGEQEDGVAVLDRDNGFVDIDESDQQQQAMFDWIMASKPVQYDDCTPLQSQQSKIAVAVSDLDRQSLWSKLVTEGVDVNKSSSFLKQVAATTDVAMDHDYSGYDPANLAGDQKRFYDQIVALVVGNSAVARCGIVSGTAGTGKSYTIGCIVKECRSLIGIEETNKRLLLCAPTGTAAFNINGQTLHRKFKLPVPLGNIADLKGESLARFQEENRGLRVVICDEMSMIGQNMFGAISKRMKQLNPENHDKEFSGVSFFLCGDFGQLPPIGDRKLYGPMGPSVGQREGFRAFQACKENCFRFQTVFRQNGDVQFADFLARLRNDELTPEDFQSILSRSSEKVSDTEQASFSDAMHLFPTRNLANAHNSLELDKLPSDKIVLDAIHSGKDAANAPPQDALNLEPELHLKSGAKVMVLQNLCTKFGIVNGSMGTVFGFLYNPNKLVDLPDSILVEIPTYCGPAFIPSEPKVVPIPATTATWFDKEGKLCSRTQFPLTLAYAITIHKCQGMTLEKAVLDPGPVEHTPGLSFVGFSRCKSLDGVLVRASDSRTLGRWRWLSKKKKKSGVIELRKQFDDYIAQKARLAAV